MEADILFMQLVLVPLVYRTSIMFFRKPQILDLAEGTLTLISPNENWKFDTGVREPLFLEPSIIIPGRPGDLIAILKTLQQAH